MLCHSNQYWYNAAGLWPQGRCTPTKVRDIIRNPNKSKINFKGEGESPNEGKRQSRNKTKRQGKSKSGGKYRRKNKCGNQSKSHCKSKQIRSVLAHELGMTFATNQKLYFKTLITET